MMSTVCHRGRFSGSGKVAARPQKISRHRHSGSYCHFGGPKGHFRLRMVSAKLRRPTRRRVILSWPGLASLSSSMHGLENGRKRVNYLPAAPSPGFACAAIREPTILALTQAKSAGKHRQYSEVVCESSLFRATVHCCSV